MTGSKELVCHNKVNTIKEDPTVDLFTEITDNNSCTRMYTSVEMNGLAAEVWECMDE